MSARQIFEAVIKLQSVGKKQLATVEIFRTLIYAGNNKMAPGKAVNYFRKNRQVFELTKAATFKCCRTKNCSNMYKRVSKNIYVNLKLLIVGYKFLKILYTNFFKTLYPSVT